MNKVKDFVAEVRLPRPTQAWNLYFITDLHFGSRACDVNLLKQDVAAIAKDPYAWVFMGGDNFEAIAPDDIRFEVDLHDWGKDYSKNVVKQLGVILDPIKKKIIAGITGNHEDKFEKRHYVDLSGMLYERLEVPYLGYSCIFPIKVSAPSDGTRRINLRTKKVVESSRNGWVTHYVLDFWGHHGAGGGSMPGSKLNRLLQAQMGFEADIYFMGHVHDQTSYIGAKIGTKNTGGMREIQKAFIVGATYYKTYMEGSTTYGERAMYRPARLGCTKLVVQHEKLHKWDADAYAKARRSGVDRKTASDKASKSNGYLIRMSL